MMQATFLRSVLIEDFEPSAAGKQLAEQLETVADEDLEVRCRRSGLATKGSKPMQVRLRIGRDNIMNIVTCSMYIM